MDILQPLERFEQDVSQVLLEAQIRRSTGPAGPALVLLMTPSSLQ